MSRTKVLSIIYIFTFSKHYNSLGFRDHDLTLYSYGEIVVAQWLGDMKWYRARIMNSDPEIDRHEVGVMKKYIM